ncbi:MAG TPA: monovalent cation/H+ antiporter complex subunit F [Anaerolineae bacterium]|nr:monovalent cation/H+ antiporter complex subunit F [Anaerolineae bacterium]HMR63813.1 monovalent cation/H+ antiporter complex subunit F [Anaerolineae bacterium]
MTLESYTLHIILPLLTVAIGLALVRIVRGPSLSDRVIALDLLATIGIGVVGVYVIATGQLAFLDVALVIALLVFLGTVGFAYYIERRA